MRTLDEAIAREKRLASGYVDEIQVMKNMGADISSIMSLTKKAEYHEQIAEWLEELKALRTWKNDVMEDFCKVDCSSVDEVYQCGQRRGCNKAIVDFAERLSEYLNVENATKYGNKNAEQQRNSYDTLMKYEIADAIDDIVEQLKAGGENDNSQV